MLELKHGKYLILHKLLNFQSYHVGIETNNQDDQVHNKYPSNRTMLELKLCTSFGKNRNTTFQSYHVGIETKN